MYCPHCGAENPESAEYCQRCGEHAAAPDPTKHEPRELGACRACSATNLIHARHCVRCGVSLGERPLILAAVDARRPASSARRVQASRRDAGTAPESREDGVGQRRTESRPSVSGYDTDLRDAGPWTEPDNDSGSPDAELPEGLRGFNWGAFLIWPIWGIGNGVWMTFFLFTPVLFPFSLYVVLLIYYALALFLGTRGNELAWRSRRWRSVDHFRQTQRAWAIWGLVIYGFNVPLLLMMASRTPSAS